MDSWIGIFGKIIMTFIISMTPVLELRGAIPFGALNGLNIWVAILVSVIGNLILIPFIIIFVNRVFAWLRKKSEWLEKAVSKLENRALKKAGAVQKYEFWGLCIFVAIPLPGTGAWTGAIIAGLLNMKLKSAFLSIALGVLMAAVIVSIITFGLGALFSL